MTRCRALLILPFAIFAAVAAARAADDSTIVLDQAWARPSLAGAPNGAAYVTLTNRGSAPDRLVAISTPVAGMAELHRDEMRGSVMTMRPAGPLDLAPGQTVAVQPDEGGLHVMLMHMTRGLKAGDHFPMTFTFEKAGAMTVDATVGTHPPGAAMHDMPMHDMPEMGH
jgi:hypothetical protein